MHSYPELATKPTPDYTEYEITVLEIANEKSRELQHRIKAGEKRDRYGDWIWMADLKPGLVD